MIHSALSLVVDVDTELLEVVRVWRAADPDKERAAGVMRQTLDQLYDGLHTGRYRWDQLYKTEKTHCGTLVEINLRREFSDIISDGQVMDYRINDTEIDCKYSQLDGGWMIPPEALGHLLLVGTADDAKDRWSLGVVRATPENLRSSHNRDAKTQLNLFGRQRIVWLARHSPLPPNVLIHLPEEVIQRVFADRSGQARINELLRLVTNQRIGRNTIATVAQQDDYMKRVRTNGGARSALAREGFLIPGGDYEAHRQVAEELGAAVPQPGEIVSLRVVPADVSGTGATFLGEKWWRLAMENEKCPLPAPPLPDTRRRSRS